MRNENKGEGIMNLEQFLNQIPNLDDYDTHLHNLTAILQNGESPSDYYNFIDSGAFKEVYQLNNNYVVKFCSTENPTQEEHKLYQIAHNELEENNIFLPVYCYYFNQNEHVDLLEVSDGYYSYDETSGEEKYNPMYATALEIQPVIECTLDQASNWCEDYDEELFSATSEEVLNMLVIWNQYDNFYLYLNNDEVFWAFSILYNYGEAGLKAIAQFFNKYYITDWHSENIGWIKQNDKLLPVIFDYFSNVEN